MRKLQVLFISIILLIPNHTNAQKNGAGIAVAAGAIAAIGVGIAAVKQMEEQAELTATQWILSNNPEMTNFSLKTMDFSGKKVKDMSAVSVITYKIQEFVPSANPILDGKKQVLFGFTSQGWINQNGIDFNKVRWFLIDAEEWMKMMVSYVKVASDESDNIILKEKLLIGKVVNKGVKIKSKLVIPFYKLTGDMYVVTDYSEDMKLLYNERSLGIFLKETEDLVQIKRSNIIEIHQFFFGEE